MVNGKYFFGFNFRRADGDHCAGHDLWSVQVMISDHVTDDNDDDNDNDDDDIQTVSERGPGLCRRLGAAALQCRHLQQPFQGDGEWVSSEQSMEKLATLSRRNSKQKFK